MANETHIEIERKYAVDESLAVPDLGAIPGVGRADRSEPVELEATYFDTEDRRLLRARIALRRRTGGHDAGWHVKLPGVGGRLEIHGPIDPADQDALPPDVLDAIRSRVRSAPLLPLAHILTTRTITRLSDSAGALRIEFADDGVRASDLRAGTVRVWHEWEAEQIGDDPDAAAELLAALEPVLLAAGATVSASPAKLAQALGHGEGGEPGVGPNGSGESGHPGSVEVESGAAAPTAGSVVREAIARHVESLHRDDFAVRFGGDRAEADEAVHSMRTTIRRLRSVLGLATVVGPAGERLRAGLQSSGAALGESRDLAVSAETAERLLGSLEADIPGQQHARARLLDEPRERSDVDRVRAIQVLNGPAHAAVLDDLEALIVAPFAGIAAARAADAVLPRLVDAEGRRAARRLRRAGDDEEALHGGRRAARRFRYLVEDLGDAAGPAKEHRISRRAARALQTDLGTYRDLTLFADELPFVAQRATAAGENAFVYGVLAERARREAARALQSARAAAIDLASALHP